MPNLLAEGARVARKAARRSARGAGVRAAVSNDVRSSLTRGTLNDSAMTAGAVGMGALTGAGVGAVTGGLFFNQDRTWHGAARGAVGGALGGAVLGAGMGVGIPALAKQAATNNKFMSRAGSYASNIVATSNQLNSAGGRNALFASGGLLAGFAFGSTNSRGKSRGFNQNRGNRFSSSGY